MADGGEGRRGRQWEVSGLALGQNAVRVLAEDVAQSGQHRGRPRRVPARVAVMFNSGAR